MAIRYFYFHICQQADKNHGNPGGRCIIVRNLGWEGENITTHGTITSDAAPEVRQSILGPKLKCKLHEGIDHTIYISFVTLSLAS